MSINKRRGRFDLAQNGREYRRILMDEVYPIYWDEGIAFYPHWNPGYVNPNKKLMRWEQRMYRSWKYNRKKQYKDEKDQDI
jgi:hypothetical protein